MRTYKKHHLEHLDGSRGTWRPTLVTSMWGADGHPIAWKEIVIVSCHNCGLQYGVGGDDNGPQIQDDGTTNSPVRCQHCKTEDHMTFDKHQEPIGREHFAKLKADALQEVKAARLMALQEHIKAQMQAELDERAAAAAREIIPDGADNPQELFKTAMKKYK